jgi:hypothetical protein
VADGSIFSVHISRVPLQGICRIGPKLKEGMPTYTATRDNIHQQQGHMTFEKQSKLLNC